MAYPLVIVVVAIGVVTLLLVFVVPSFAKQFSESGQQNDERELDGNDQSLFGRAPPAHRASVETSPDENDRDAEQQPFGCPILDPFAEHFGLTSQENTNGLWFRTGYCGHVID